MLLERHCRDQVARLEAVTWLGLDFGEEKDGEESRVQRLCFDHLPQSMAFSFVHLGQHISCEFMLYYVTMLLVNTSNVAILYYCLYMGIHVLKYTRLLSRYVLDPLMWC